MGKKFQYSIAVILLVTFCGAFVFAASPTGTSLEKTIGGKSCEIKLSELSFAGILQPFDDTGAICVDAKDDIAAVKECTDRGYHKARVINPENKQYNFHTKKVLAELPNEYRTGKRDKNNFGYYYCVKNVPENRKHDLCNKANSDSYYLAINKDYRFHWVPAFKGSTDGDCYCYKSGEKIPTHENGQHQCDILIDDSPPKSEAANAFEAPQPEPTTAAAATPTPTSADSVLKICLDGWKTEANNCQNLAKEAKDACSTNKDISDDNKETMSAIQQANQLYTGLKTGAGAQQQCFTASLVANAAVGALNDSKDSCDASKKSCDNSCTENKLKEYRDLCHSKINPIDADPLQEAAQAAKAKQVELNQAYFTNQEKEITSIFEAAIKICDTDVKDALNTLSGVLTGVGKSLASSIQCMCKLSNGTAVKDCNDIPSFSACNLNPGGPGCIIYGALNVCTPGGGYDAHLCRCQTNPKTAGCPAYAIGGLSNFAGTQLKVPANPAGNGDGMFAGNLKADSSELAMPTAEDEEGHTKLEVAGSGGAGPSPGGPSGGLGGGGGPSGGPAAEAGVVPEEKGLAGLFNQAKSFMSGAFGSKKKSDTGNTSNGKNAAGADANKFRPSRGVASKNGFGTKNQDIFVMMNRCFIAESCAGNSNNFLDTALKQK